ncbi:exosortase/archaeosortase family protein [Horticoccus luteus]|uniref:Exosortase/archaeosortase family protein n=1 Tax=Horticoccus luteus TaxID=2862869 RepID=A0A8F9TX29_9BACT|nr:exosortase/archaeosortase family protein [Horticoccus luteus]QYM79338.1 exosortase/archaeosortase family protein [Horticoccus luteus]
MTATPGLRWPTASIVLLGALVLLWVGGVWRLQMVWSHVPDYAFGWAVPVLAAFLLWERWPDRPDASETRTSGWWWAALAGTLLVLGFTRLLLEPFPAWPMMLWLFTGALVAVTLLLLACQRGGRTARHFAFPAAFIATALPWPAVLNTHLIAPLRETLAGAVAQAVNLLGYPAIAHGTVIEVGHGFIGVEEACSGIRSLQAAIMVALFLGELNRFAWRRRLAILGIGVGLALGSNGARTLFLAWESAVHGPTAVAEWHDPAGYALLVVCLGGLVAVGWWWRKYAGKVAVRTRRVQAPAAWRGRRSTQMAWVAIAACSVIEGGTQAWYARGDLAADAVMQLTANLPADAEGFQEDPFDATMQALLLCDAHEVGHWNTRDGHARAGYVLEWWSGQSARFATALHNPTVCLPMSGKALERARGIVPLTVGGVALPFQAYVFSSERGPMRVYYLQWDVRAGESFATRTGSDGPTSWLAQQWQDVRRARRNFQAMVIGLAVWGARDDRAADRALERELPAIITVRAVPAN